MIFILLLFDFCLAGGFTIYGFYIRKIMTIIEIIINNKTTINKNYNQNKNHNS